jgi:hypothetical protein
VGAAGERGVDCVPRRARAAPAAAPGRDPFIRPAELEELARGAGLEPQRLVDLDWPWEYADRETALRGWLSPGPSTLAIQASGEAAVRDALAQTLEQFRLTDGGYRLENTVHCLIARPGDARGSRR